MTCGVPVASSTFMLTGKRISRSDSRNRLSIRLSASMFRLLGSMTTRMSSADSSRTSPSSGAFFCSISSARASISLPFWT